MKVGDKLYYLSVRTDYPNKTRTTVVLSTTILKVGRKYYETGFDAETRSHMRSKIYKDSLRAVSDYVSMQYYTTPQEAEDALWLSSNKYALCHHIERMENAALLKKIAELVGFAK